MIKSWASAFKGYLNPKIFLFLFLGFSCGIPYNLIGYSLSLWMRNQGLSLETIGLFSLVFVPYSLKFLWAPFIDRIKLPILSRRLGPKKAWLLIFQIGLMISIAGLAVFANAADMTFTFVFAFLTAFFAASQDIVVDALRIDTLEKNELGEGASTYQLGYRLALFVGGACVVMASDYIAWETAYLVVATLVFLGMCAGFFVREPERRMISQHIFKDMVVAPFLDFAKRHRAWFLIVAFIVLYKLCNAILGRMAMPFYADVGFSKAEIGLISGTFGPWVTIVGVFIGGALVARYNILKCLMGLGFVEIFTSIAFAGLAVLGNNATAFAATIVFDNIVGGMGGAVFVAYLSGLCSRSFSATQYALLTSLMAVSTSFVAAYSGVWANHMGWPLFFLFTGVLMIPALILLQVLNRITSPKTP